MSKGKGKNKAKDIPPVDQIAALPVHWDKTGKLRVLMVTSRDRGRWVMPKGWEMDGKKPWHAAEIEALEEAGAVGFISDTPIGHYHYDKRLENGKKLPCRVTLYPMLVDTLKKRWKERKERKRHWFSPKKAAKLVEEKELASLLKALNEQNDVLMAIRQMRDAA
ncbi:MAG: NUDIX domain-containing protein [Marivita sp.]|uniref:NUDIX hydrolase n=1 Tax=Marivita sp. TaxID=2003365 RepID=UPI0025BD98CD|nr:NUDIX domain-containing protein [Marivita sp.]MCI5112213.1 NUDIX domain-containing protein [Marivita sp.]